MPASGFSRLFRIHQSHSLGSQSVFSVLLFATTLGCGSGAGAPAIDDNAATEESQGAETSSVPEHTDGGNTPTPDGGSTPTPDARTDGGASPERCTPGPGATGNPRTIVEVVDLINSLPMPVTLPCLLQSLERPIQLIATTSIISAQPANGHDNPRLFLFREGLSLSVVPAGSSSHLLELGELTSNTRSIKGEIEFPVTEPLEPTAPFHRISRPSGGTICYLCHHDEVAAENYPVPDAFESVAYRPVPRLEVNFDYVQYQYTTCDSAADPARCAFYAALFDQGQVSRGEFPAEMATFE